MCRYFKNYGVLIVGLLCAINIEAQNNLNLTDSTVLSEEVRMEGKEDVSAQKITYSALIIPVALIGYGIAGQTNDKIQEIDHQVDEHFDVQVNKTVRIDDALVALPILGVYGLNILGVKGQHGLKNRTIILAIASTLTGATVLTMKELTNNQRPDDSTADSFPSGHTAIAFMGAEFLRQEYKERSPWYGVAAYALATTTGFFRLYNDRHWVTDVAMGAGIGILSTKIAYWIYPFFDEMIFKKETNVQSVIHPFFSGEYSGIAIQLTL